MNTTTASSLVEACDQIRNALGMSGEPVGVAYLPALPQGKDASVPIVACQAIQDARRGQLIYLHQGNSKCLGASYFLGFEPFSELSFEFWVNNEQSLLDVEAARKMVASHPSPPNARNMVVAIFPAHLHCHQPDLVMFVCNPLQASRLLGLHMFKRGTSPRFYGYGATCQTSIGIPHHAREPGVSFIDVPSREIADFQEDEVLVSIPATDIPDVAESIPLSINGTAEPRFNRKGLIYLKGNWTLRKEQHDEKI